LLIGTADLPNAAAAPNAVAIHCAVIVTSCEMTEGTTPARGDDALV